MLMLDIPASGGISRSLLEKAGDAELADVWPIGFRPLGPPPQLSLLTSSRLHSGSYLILR